MKFAYTKTDTPVEEANEMNPVTGSSVMADVQQVIDRVRKFSEGQKLPSVTGVEGQNASVADFGGILSKAESMINHVSQLKESADNTAQAWLTGSGTTSVSDVVVASEKSRLAMEGLITVRNKVLEAYREIMNMQV